YVVPGASPCSVYVVCVFGSGPLELGGADTRPDCVPQCTSKPSRNEVIAPGFHATVIAVCVTPIGVIETGGSSPKPRTVESAVVHADSDAVFVGLATEAIVP